MLFEAIGAALEAGEVLEAFPAQSGAQRAEFWALRHGTAEANRRGGHVLSADISVPVSAVPDFLATAPRAVRTQFPQTDFVVVSHMGDGNVHFGTRFSAAEWKALADPAETTLAVRRIVNDCAQALGGSFSAEHGIGRKLTAELAERTDPAGLLLMRMLKAAIDPSGIMNPGCLLG
jgi:FAD/FMN-containing dehydrogenase